MLQPVQRGTDQRRDDRKGRDRDEQVQRDLALALPGGGGEEQCVGQRDGHRRIDGEVGHHRIGQRGEPRLVGAVCRGGAVKQAVHLRAHLAAALGRTAWAGRLLPETLSDAGIAAGRRPLLERRQIAVRARWGTSLTPVIHPVAGVVRHAGVFVTVVGGRARRVVAGITSARAVPWVTPRSAHKEILPHYGDGVVQPTGCGCAQAGRALLSAWTA